MNQGKLPPPESHGEDDQPIPGLSPNYGVSRRSFVQTLTAGLLISVTALPVLGQRSNARASRGRTVAARIHLGVNGRVTVLTGKVEMGRGARAQLSQAAAEELRISVEQVDVIMGDTGQVPDDGITAGSRTTPATVPAVRQGAAAARQLLIRTASRHWGVEPGSIKAQDGKIVHTTTSRVLPFAELASGGELQKFFDEEIPSGISVTPVQEWKVMGASVPRPNRREIVTGAHEFPSDLFRPGMLYGKVLRPPAYGAKLVSIDLAPAKAMKDVVAVHDGQFAGVAAPTTYLARKALEAISDTATWQSAPHPSSRELYDYLRARAQGGVPKNPFELDGAKQVLRQTYHVAYVQHAPLEPRSALAEWSDQNLTVCTGTQNPFGYHNELASTFRLSNDQVRVIVPDFGSGFGGKHTAEAAIEAARLARAAERPVLLTWTREEEFTWAYFRPAAVIDVEAGLDEQGAISSWHFVNINSGRAAIDTPYRAGKAQSHFVSSDPPLRQGSYRALAAAANNFARESFMDELAAAAGTDPLEFRLAHLEHPRLKAVLEEAARRFDWRSRTRDKQPGLGLGMACGTEKGSYVAACVEIAVDQPQNLISVRRVCQVFECGAIINPDNLMAQVQGCIIMGLGPALQEEMRFANGRIRNAQFDRYAVPRFSNVPELDVHLLNRPDLPSAGGSETPIMAVAPAIANAVFYATGRRIRSMPVRLS
jgi:isoquinoline 1-oxidoreductase subunit beta